MEILVEKTAAELRQQYTDTKGRPVGSDLTAAKLTLYNDADGTVINLRDEQSVFNANGGTYTGTLTITGVSLADPVVITSVGHPLKTGDRIYISGVVGTTQLNGRSFVVERISDDTFSLVGVDGRDFTAYASGGTGKIGLLVVNLDPADNVLVGVVTNGTRQRHVAKVVVTVSGRDTATEHIFEVEQRPKPA